LAERASFDVLNRMTQATLGGTTVDFVYDPNNRQAQKSVSSVDTGFLYDGVQMIAEYDGSTLEKRYIPGILPDEVLIKIESSTKTYFHKDRLGSVVAVTDASGDVLSSVKYGPFGETPSLTETPFGYTGQRFDSELGSYYYKARYYSPAIGRFLQPDPIGFKGGLNVYGYVSNDPLNLSDPMGLQDAPLYVWQNMHLPPTYAPGVYLYSKIFEVHTGIFVVKPDGKVQTIDGAYSKFPPSGNLEVHMKNSENVPHSIPFWGTPDSPGSALSNDPAVIQQMVHNAEALQKRLQQDPLPYSLVPDVYYGEGHTSNEVWPELLRQTGLKVPNRFAPGKDRSLPRKYCTK
jgi:RHS repeat-associated protein